MNVLKTIDLVAFQIVLLGHPESREQLQKVIESYEKLDKLTVT